MSLTVVGSIAFDAVETEAGKRDRLLGGAAVHFSLASSFLAETRVVGPVGDDFTEEEYAVLRNRGVITDRFALRQGRTLFTRLGDWVAWTSLALAAISVGVAGRRSPCSAS